MSRWLSEVEMEVEMEVAVTLEVLIGIVVGRRKGDAFRGGEMTWEHATDATRILPHHILHRRSGHA
jgi:hypothetical protein